MTATPHFATLAIAIALTGSVALAAQAPAATPPAAKTAPAKPAATVAVINARPLAPIKINVRDLSVRFLSFYEAALTPPPPPPAPPAPTVDKDGKPIINAPAVPVVAPAPVESAEDRRWRFWKKAYDFSPIKGDDARRAALEAAFPRYEAVAPQIRAGFDGISQEINQVFQPISRQLHPEKDVAIRYVTYVGTFGGEVWTEVEDGVHNINLPLETGPETRRLPLARALIPYLMERSAVWGSTPRNLAEVIIAEGVAAYLAKETAPGMPEHTYLGLTAEQLAIVRGNRKVELSAILGKLGERTPLLIESYTRGDKVPAAKLAGWLLVGEFLKDGERIADLVRQEPNDLARASLQPLAAVNVGK